MVQLTLMVRWVVGSILHGGTIELFIVAANDMCYPVCVMMHIKEPLLLIEKNTPCSGGSGFPP